MQADAPEFVPTGALMQVGLAERNLPAPIPEAPSQPLTQWSEKFRCDADRPVRSLPVSGLFCPVCAAGDWCAFHSVDSGGSSNDGGSWPSGYQDGSPEDVESYSTTDYDDVDTGDGEKWVASWAGSGAVLSPEGAPLPDRGARRGGTGRSLPQTGPLQNHGLLSPWATASASSGGTPTREGAFSNMAAVHSPHHEGPVFGSGVSQWSPMWGGHAHAGQGPR